MGSFGDFLKGVGSGIGDAVGGALINNPVTQGVAQGAEWLGEKYIEHQSEQAARAPGLPQPEAGRGQMVPGQPGRNIRFTGETAVADTASEWNRQNVETAESIIGFANVGKEVVTHPVRSYKTARTVGTEIVHHPGILVDAFKATATDMAIGAALNPATYMGGGFLLAAELGEQSAVRAGERTLARAGEKATVRTLERGAARSADDVAGRLVARSADDVARSMAPEGLDKALSATARRANPNASARFLERVDTGDANLRETITGNPSGKLGQKRFDLGERIMPGAQTSVPKALLKDALQGSPTLPTEGAGLGFRTAKWRAQQVGRRLAMPAQARTTRRVGQILYDPRRALSDPSVQGWAGQAATWAVEEHPEAVAAVGGLVVAGQAMGAYSTFKSIKAAMGGGEDAAAAEAAPKPKEQPAFEQPTTPTTSAIGLMQFRADQTHATRATRRRAGGRSQLGTVSNTTMPDQIGPSDWYGRASGYDAGRGFQRRETIPSEPLRPLMQPDGGWSRSSTSGEAYEPARV